MAQPSLCSGPHTLPSLISSAAVWAGLPASCGQGLASTVPTPRLAARGDPWARWTMGRSQGGAAVGLADEGAGAQLQGLTHVPAGFQASVLLLGGSSAHPATSSHHPLTLSQGRCSPSSPRSWVSVVPGQNLCQGPLLREALPLGVSLRPSWLSLLLTPTTQAPMPAGASELPEALAALCWAQGEG